MSSALDGLWVDAWWPVIMVVCALMMGGMMRHRMMGSHHRDGDAYTRETPERILANRLARREIDVDEYTRLLEALPVGPTEARRN